jgi:hypothetical protein
MSNGQKNIVIAIAVVLLVGFGYWLRGYLHNDAGTIQRMAIALDEANANNQRLTAARDKLEQLNFGLTEENNRSRKYSQELEIQLGEVREYADSLERNNRADEKGLAESAEINRRTKILIGEVGKTGK